MGLSEWLIAIAAGSGGGASLILDTYSGAAVAYSLRKLRTAYAGSAIRVRRSSDSAEQDIGFASGVLDTASLLSFVGAGNGFVTTWYDQSGNGRNATQATSSSQPQIVSSGSVLVSGSKPKIVFATDSLNLGTTFAWESTSLACGVFQSSSTGAVSVGLINYLSPTDSPEMRFGVGSLQHAYWNSGYALLNSATMAYLTRGVFSVQFAPGITVSTFKNGSQTDTATRAGTWTLSPSEFKFGRYDAASGNRDGEMQEFILWNSDQSANRAAIESNINSHYAIY